MHGSSNFSLVVLNCELKSLASVTRGYISAALEKKIDYVSASVSSCIETTPTSVISGDISAAQENLNIISGP